MCAKRKERLLLQSWLALLFRQPPQGFYRAPAVYLSGGRMEVEHFCRILAYGPDGRETAEHRRAYFREEEQAL